MYTFLSQLATARKSFAGENWRSDMLSEGSCPAGTSTSLLVSPVVELVAAAGVDPKSAIVEFYPGSIPICEIVVPGKVEALREPCYCSRRGECANTVVGANVAVDVAIVGETMKAGDYIEIAKPQTGPQLSLMSRRRRASTAKEDVSPSFLGTPAGTNLLSPSAAFGQTFGRRPRATKHFLRALLLFQRSSLKESQRSTRTEHLRVSLHALGESPRTSVILTAPSATNRHRSAAPYHYCRTSLSFPLRLSVLQLITCLSGTGWHWMMT